MSMIESTFAALNEAKRKSVSRSINRKLSESKSRKITEDEDEDEIMIVDPEKDVEVGIEVTDDAVIEDAIPVIDSQDDYVGMNVYKDSITGEVFFDTDDELTEDEDGTLTTPEGNEVELIGKLVPVEAEVDCPETGETLSPAEEVPEVVDAKDLSSTEKSDEDEEFFDDEAFEELTSSYIKNFKNVKSLKCGKVSKKNGRLYIEAKVKYNSGNLANALFITSPITKGRNIRLAIKESKVFKMTGKCPMIIECVRHNNVITPKKMSYNYRMEGSRKNITGKSIL